MSDGLVVMYRAERSGGYQQYVPWKTFDSTREAHVTSLCASPSQHIIGCIVKDVGFLTLDLAAAVTVHGGIDGGSAENLFTESITPCGTIVAMDVNEQRYAYLCLCTSKLH